jgi:hypothetical protein
VSAHRWSSNDKEPAFTETVLKERARYRHLGWVPEHPTDGTINV